MNLIYWNTHARAGVKYFGHPKRIRVRCVLPDPFRGASRQAGLAELDQRAEQVVLEAVVAGFPDVAAV